MRDYNRTTRACAFRELPAEIGAAFAAYAEKNEIENLEAAVTLCVETAAEKIEKGFFARLFGPGAAYAVRTAMLLTPERLLWCTLDAHGRAVVSAARWREIEVTDFSSNLVEDAGLDVFGFVDGSSERVQVFLGLGAEPAAEEFRRLAKQAARGAS
jgi:hypothetical protein